MNIGNKRKLRMRIRSLLAIIAFLFTTKEYCYADDNSNIEARLLRQFQEVENDFLNFGIQGYYPRGNFRLNDQPNYVVAGENDFGVQPLLFLKVRDPDTMQILYTRYFKLTLLDNGLLGIDNKYEIIPEIRIGNQWKIYKDGASIIIADNESIYKLHFYVPTYDEYEVISEYFYTFPDAVELEYYSCEVGVQEIPTRDMETSILIEMDNISALLKKELEPVEYKELMEGFLKNLELFNPSSFNNFIGVFQSDGIIE